METRADWQYTRECLETECWLTGGNEDYGEEYSEVSSSPPTPDWMKSCDSYWNTDDIDSEEEEEEEEQLQRARGCYVVPIPATTTTTTPPATNTNTDVFNPNDPLRNFLVNRKITLAEYERWKIVHQTTTPSTLTLEQQQQQRKKRIDFGPGHNSVSESESDDGDDDGNTTHQTTTTIYGSGYSTLLYSNVPIDSWNPNPDPTPDMRYTALAKSHEFMSRCLVDEHDQQLASAFIVKLVWERYAFHPSPDAPWERYTLRNFWEENALVIYDALQVLVDKHARVHRGTETETMQANMIPPPYNVTPIDTLEITFETIGKMCRCIADDFNTPSIDAYVKEFIISLYRELVFITLVETHMRQQPFSAVFDKNAVMREFYDIEMQKSTDPMYRAELMTTEEYLAKKRQQRQQ